MKKTGAVLVAAGLSSRMKDFKPMLPFGGSTVSRHMVSMLKDMDIDPVAVVTGYRAEQLESHLSHAGVRFVRNERYRETEMFDSIRLGVEAIASDCERIMILPIDIPALMPETIRQTLMIDAPILRTMCKGEPGHPIIIQTDVFPVIWQNDGHRGLRGAMEESGILITNLEVEDEGIYKDMDTKDEYRELLEWNYDRGQGYPVKPFVQVGLKAGEKFFGPGACELLELIDQTGSVQEACARMNLSYSKGSRILKNIERQMGQSTVQRWAGGVGGGGAELTEKGKWLIVNYRKMEAEIESAAAEAFDRYFEEG